MQYNSIVSAISLKEHIFKGQFIKDTRSFCAYITWKLMLINNCTKHNNKNTNKNDVKPTAFLKWNLELVIKGFPDGSWTMY